MKKIRDMSINEYCSIKKHPKFKDMYPFATGSYTVDRIRCSKGFVNFDPRIKKGNHVIEIGNWFTRTFLPKELFVVTYVSDYSPIITIKSLKTDLEKKILMRAVRLAGIKEVENLTK